MRAKTRFQGTAFPSRRRGYSLMEMLAVMAALGVILLVGGATLLGAMKVQQGAAAAFTRLAVRSALADQFRMDVSQAAGVPDSADQWKASPTCLILRTADGKHVIYQWSDNQLKRFEHAGSSEAERLMPVGPDCVAVEFARTGADSRVIIMRLTAAPGHGSVNRPVEISAASGGDLR